MSDVATIRRDLAKRVFQVHAVDAAGVVILRRKLRRADVLRVFVAQPLPCRHGSLCDIA